VPLRKLKQFQDLGHQVIFLIGDFTARIGDPSGRSDTRPRLSEEQIKENARTYLDQVYKILDREKTKIVYNSSWLGALTFSDVIELSAKYSVARMLERDDFKKRFREEKPIFIHEFLYPLMQGYDSVALGADVEIGGTDQKFNLLVARELQREYGQKPQTIMTLPLLVGTDGVNKMSKSLNNYIGITEPAQEIYGKVMSISDELMLDYFLLVLSYSREEVEALRKGLDRGEINPRELKARLAREIVSAYYDEETARNAEAEFDRVFKLRQTPKDIEEQVISTENNTLWVVRLLVMTNMAKSNREARKLISEGGVYLNSERVIDINLEIPPGEYILRVGKRRFKKVIIVSKSK
ncbi:tyrosine--tRNA ligase, partial [Candidatus Sumerlaeota bacterium]|nr:tyrosine--tRNA ligase [Candidatus Sumerlaeota bacterium]